MAVRGALSPLSGLICEIVNSVGQGKFYICQKKRQGKFREIKKTSGSGNHVLCKCQCGAKVARKREIVKPKATLFTCAVACVTGT